MLYEMIPVRMVLTGALALLLMLQILLAAAVVDFIIAASSGESFLRCVMHTMKQIRNTQQHQEQQQQLEQQQEQGQQPRGQQSCSHGRKSSRSWYF